MRRRRDRPGGPRGLIPTDLDRAVDAIRDLNLRGPQEARFGEFMIPTNPRQRARLADLVYDLVDQYAARAILDAPEKYTIVHHPRKDPVMTDTATNAWATNNLRELRATDPRGAIVSTRDGKCGVLREIRAPRDAERDGPGYWRAEAVGEHDLLRGPLYSFSVVLRANGKPVTDDDLRFLQDNGRNALPESLTVGDLVYLDAHRTTRPAEPQVAVLPPTAPPLAPNPDGPAPIIPRPPSLSLTFTDAEDETHLVTASTRWEVVYETVASLSPASRAVLAVYADLIARAVHRVPDVE